MICCGKPSMRLSINEATFSQLAASGLGWEDIAAIMRIKGASSRAAFRERYFYEHRILPPAQQDVGLRLPGDVRGLRGRN
jgi:hypothetical protein